MSMATELTRLKDAFTNAGFQYAYNMYPTDDGAPAFPFVTAYVSDGDGFLADDENYQDTMNVVVCLFTKFKSPQDEDRVREVLKSLELTYSWSESYVTSEQIYIITYNFSMEV